MKIIGLFLLLFFLLNISCFSQKMIVHVYMENRKQAADNDTIFYDFNRPLKWNDFRGKPDYNYFAGAVTSSGFAFDSQINFDGTNINLNIGVYTFFTKNDSWKKPEINSDYHLLHEQHHFDITRLSTQQFIDDISKAHFTKDNYQKLLSSTFDKAYEKNMDTQHLYDQETNHSINTSKQMEWNNKIADEIQKLKNGVASQN